MTSVRFFLREQGNEGQASSATSEPTLFAIEPAYS